jgi:RNA polymerase sigma factor (sigma-70 family)
MLTPDQFAEAYERCYSRTVRFLQSRGVGPDVAEEVAQSAWARGWERQSQLESDSAFLPWVNSIALNALRVYLRKQTRTPQCPEDFQEKIPAKQSISLNDRHDLRNLLARCTPQDQQLLWAYWGEGFTSNEIAAKLKIKAVSVRVRITRIAHSLNAKLQTGTVHGLVTAGKS